MKKSILNVLLNLGNDIFFGLIISIIVSFLLKHFIPNLMSQILPPLIYNENSWKTISESFGIITCFFIIFSIRFILAYLQGNYTFKEKNNG